MFASAPLQETPIPTGFLARARQRWRENDWNNRFRKIDDLNGWGSLFGEAPILTRGDFQVLEQRDRQRAVRREELERLTAALRGALRDAEGQRPGGPVPLGGWGQGPPRHSSAVPLGGWGQGPPLHSTAIPLGGWDWDK